MKLFSRLIAGIFLAVAIVIIPISTCGIWSGLILRSLVETQGAGILSGTGWTFEEVMSRLISNFFWLGVGVSCIVLAVTFWTRNSK